MTTVIGVINQSKEIADSDFQTMLMANQLQLFSDYCPKWGTVPTPIVPIKKPDDVGLDSQVFTLTDDEPPQTGIMAYHTELTGGRKGGPVFVGVLFRNGANALNGAYNACSTLGHEILEGQRNPTVNRWVDTGNGGEQCDEVCDPVEAQFYRANGIAADLTNFVTPYYFDSMAVGQQLDQMGRLTSPFSIDDGGYAIRRSSAGDEHQVFGAVVPPVWRLAMKRYQLGRSGRMLCQQRRQIP